MQPDAKTTADLSDARRALLKRYLGGGMAGADTKPAGIPKRDESRPVALSYSQQQIWLHSQLAGESLIYNEPVTIRRTGDLNRPALMRSFTEVVRRHESWRTTFLWDGNQVVQIVHPAPAHIEIPFVDLRAHPQPEQEALRLATEDARQPFDLGRGPMYRLRLVRVSDADHRLYLTLHHIIFDGVSLYRVLLPELLTSPTTPLSEMNLPCSPNCRFNTPTMRSGSEIRLRRFRRSNFPTGKKSALTFRSWT